MAELLTAAQMRAIEAAAIASGEVTGLDLMERAGRGVVAAIFEEWPELRATSHRALVLCGPGNNGGDGFVVARLLKEGGWEVKVLLYGDPEMMPPDARVNYQRWRGMGLVVPLSDETMDRYAENHPGTVIAVDALFGTGLSRPFNDLVRVQNQLNHWQAACAPCDLPHVVAVDIPSGICADSGLYLGVDDTPFDCRIMANLTVSFHRPKLGHCLNDGPIGSGKTVVADIGLSDTATVDAVTLVEAGGIGGIAKESRQHKYSHGHALILCGGPGKGGAARLAARGALRIGAGLVTVGCPPEALTENATRLDAVMVRSIADADALGRVLEDARINALCLGPGLGAGEREAALVAAALGVGTVSPPPPSPPHQGKGGRADQKPIAGGEGRGAPRSAVVLDADALTLLAQKPALFAALHERCVLTPHAGEFARLFPDIAKRLAAPATKGPAYSKVDACREAAARAGCVVLCKGPDTVIADPQGRCSINSAQYGRAAPWLATAGSGDVLAGFVTGLLARGFSPMAAVEAATWLHVDCARKFGPGLIAEDLPEQIPAVFRDLGL